jgi:hypothetical protein
MTISSTTYSLLSLSCAGQDKLEIRTVIRDLRSKSDDHYPMFGETLSELTTLSEEDGQKLLDAFMAYKAGLSEEQLDKLTDEATLHFLDNSKRLRIAKAKLKASSHH